MIPNGATLEHPTGGCAGSWRSIFLRRLAEPTMATQGALPFPVGRQKGQDSFQERPMDLKYFRDSAARASHFRFQFSMMPFSKSNNEEWRSFFVLRSDAVRRIELAGIAVRSPKGSGPPHGLAL